MQRSWTVSLFRIQQPNEAAWRRLVALVRTWNAGHAPPFTPLMNGQMWMAGFDTGTRDQLDVLLAALEAEKGASGAEYHLSWRDTAGEDDWAGADFVQVTGADLEDTSRPFIVNRDEALGPSQPCPMCGWRDVFDAVQLQPFVLDERGLARETAGQPPPGGGQWDAVTLPSGHNMVSRRVAELLKQNHVTGCELRDVIDAASGEPSPRWFQLLARRAVLVPCPEHSTVLDGAFCPRCGTAHGTLESDFFVRSDWLGGDELFSRHPGRGAMLCLGSRVFHLLRQAKVTGFEPSDVFRVCSHG